MTIAKIEAWKTSDGRIFESAAEAEAHAMEGSIAALGGATAQNIHEELANAAKGSTAGPVEAAVSELATLFWKVRNDAAMSARPEPDLWSPPVGATEQPAAAPNPVPDGGVVGSVE